MSFEVSKEIQLFVETWFQTYNFDIANLHLSSESRGNRCYPHSFRDVWYSTAAATPLMEAAATGELRVIEYILKRCPESIRCRDGEFQNSALHLALERANYDVVIRLFDALSHLLPDDALFFAQAKNALGSTPAMLSTRSLPSNQFPAEACPAWCLVNGLFDERQKVSNINADNIPRLDEQAIIIALRDASRTMRSSLAQWTMKQAAEMYALDIALFGLVYSSNAPLAGVAIAVEPILRASHTIYLKKEQSHRILAFYHILLDLDFFPSSYSYLGGSHSRPRRTAKRQWKAHLPPPTTEHLLFSR